jgi:hypothetical protein
MDVAAASIAVTTAVEHLPRGEKNTSWPCAVMLRSRVRRVIRGMVNLERVFIWFRVRWRVRVGNACGS